MGSGGSTVMICPNSKSPKIDAILNDGVEHILVRKGSIRWETANEYSRNLLKALQKQGIRLGNVMLVCDNAPCHSRQEQVVAEILGVELMRLVLYSPMPNPIDNIWNKVKASIKRHSRIP